MLTDLDTLRLRFEASERESEHGFNLHKYGIGYADEATQARWEAWIACRAAMLNHSGDAADMVEPVSNRDELPAKCWCQTCRPVTMNDMRFVVCPECGNKRCPRANDHRNACTGSNAPGQDGSAYPAAPKEVG